MLGTNKRKRRVSHLISFGTRKTQDLRINEIEAFYLKHPEIYERVIGKIVQEPKTSHFQILSEVLLNDLESRGLIGRLAGLYFTWKFLGGKRPSGLWLNFILPGVKARHLIEGLDDLYEESWLPKHGPTWAKWIYHVQCVGAVFSVWVSPLRKAIGWVLRIYVIGG